MKKSNIITAIACILSIAGIGLGVQSVAVSNNEVTYNSTGKAVFKSADGSQDVVFDSSDFQKISDTVTAGKKTIADELNKYPSVALDTLNKIYSFSELASVIDTLTDDANATSNSILSGKTAYVAGQKLTGSIPSKSAQTYTPGTSDQTISSGQYLTGTQTIKGDSSLTSDNIVKGASIFGVSGNVEPESHTTMTSEDIRETSVSSDDTLTLDIGKQYNIPKDKYAEDDITVQTALPKLDYVANVNVPYSATAFSNMYYIPMSPHDVYDKCLAVAVVVGGSGLKQDSVLPYLKYFYYDSEGITQTANVCNVDYKLEKVVNEYIEVFAVYLDPTKYSYLGEWYAWAMYFPAKSASYKCSLYYFDVPEQDITINSYDYSGVGEQYIDSSTLSPSDGATCTVYIMAVCDGGLFFVTVPDGSTVNLAYNYDKNTYSGYSHFMQAVYNYEGSSYSTYGVKSNRTWFTFDLELW